MSTPSPCPRCHGTGNLTPDTPSVHEMLNAPECPDCDGTGEVWPEETAEEREQTAREEVERQAKAWEAARTGACLPRGTVTVRL